MLCKYFRNASFKRSYKTVSAVDAINAQKLHDGHFIDVRVPEQFNRMAPRSFLNIPFYEVLDDKKPLPSTINHTDPIYLSCLVGYRSEQVARALEGQGYTNVAIVEGGITFWIFYGGPVMGSPEINKIDAIDDETPSLQLLVNQAKQLGIDVSSAMEGRRHPKIDNFFPRDEQAETLKHPPLFDINKV